MQYICIDAMYTVHILYQSYLLSVIYIIQFTPLLYHKNASVSSEKRGWIVNNMLDEMVSPNEYPAHNGRGNHSRVKPWEAYPQRPPS